MYAKKSLGQNFLNSPSAVIKIVDSAKLTKKDIVLEIGPGKGVLTKELLNGGKQVVAIEKDKDLISILEEKFASELKSKKLILINADVLKINLEKLGFKNGEFKIVANIPYYITGQLLRMFLENDIKPSLLVFLVQKEVAERIARSKKESLLSLSVKAFGEPKYIATVPKTAFIPAPKVDSAILLIDNISAKNFKNKTEQELFFEIIHAGFGQKRKLLLSNLKKSTWTPGVQVEEVFEFCGIDKKSRAEDVGLEQWLCLIHKFK